MKKGKKDKFTKLNDEFREFINNDILTKDFKNYSADKLKKVKASDWYDKRSKHLSHKLIIGSEEDYINENTFLIMGLAIISSKIMYQLNRSIESKKIGLLESYLDELNESNPQELNHSQLLKANLFHLDFKKHVNKELNWDSPLVDYVHLKESLIQRLKNYISTLNDIRFKDFGSTKVRASKKMTNPKVESPFLTLKEAAAYCKKSESTIRNHMRSGKLVYDAGGKTEGYLFLKETLDDYLGKT